MKVYFLLIVALAAAVTHPGNGDNSGMNPKIWGGIRVDETHGDVWKPMVALYLHTYGNQKILVCGGTLITDRIILTAAHCLQCGFLKYPPANITAVHGFRDLSDEEVYHFPIANTYVHEDYNPLPTVNDIALAVLTYRLGSRARINLPYPGYDFGDMVDMEAHIGGWGVTDDIYLKTKLRQATVKIVPNDACHTWLNASTHLCAMKVTGDACSGDSGGPLFTLYNDTVIQVGIISGGKRCSLENSTGTYTRLDRYQEWLGETIPLSVLD